jgi:hypothetical protein
MFLLLKHAAMFGQRRANSLVFAPQGVVGNAGQEWIFPSF